MSNNLKRKLVSHFDFPAPAALKHFAGSVAEAFKITASRKHIPHTNTVFNPLNHYVSGLYHFVSGKAWNVIAGPRGKNGRPAFLTIEDKGHQIDKFQRGGVGHREGPANTLVPHTKSTAVAVRESSSDPTRFGEL